MLLRSVLCRLTGLYGKRENLAIGLQEQHRRFSLRFETAPGKVGEVRLLRRLVSCSDRYAFGKRTCNRLLGEAKQNSPHLPSSRLPCSIRPCSLVNVAAFFRGDRCGFPAIAVSAWMPKGRSRVWLSSCTGLREAMTHWVPMTPSGSVRT
jgi:hypothetical protein